MGNLPEPVGLQREVVYLRERGHVVVLGTAGSGKTTMAVHRAVYLADEAPDNQGKTLLVTFNKALTNYLRKGMGVRSPNLVVENFHSFARGYLSSRGLLQGNRKQICDDDRVLQAALTEILERYPDRAVVARGRRFFQDEFHWLSGHGVTNLEDYIRADRIGRGKPLHPRDRELVFEAREAYLRNRSQRGYLYDWDDLAMSVHRELVADPTPRMYRHIVVDEGQDFTPEMIRVLVQAVPAHGSLTFFGDYAQQLYGSRMSWRSLGLLVSRPVEFQQNYRNSKQIAELAVAMSNMPHFRDDVDLVVPKAPIADGPLPAIWRQPTREAQLNAAVAWAKDLGTTLQVAILCRTRDEDATLGRLLGPRAVRLHKSMNTWLTGAGVFYGTYHAAKGLEFDAVVLPWCDADSLPLPAEVQAHGRDEAAAREARLLYVAVTRARVRLVIMHSSTLTPLLPGEMSGLYDIVSS